MGIDDDGTLELPADHFVRATGIRVTLGPDGTVDGTSALRPEFFAPGTTRVRVGVLLTMLDVIAGHVPDGATTPTVDLRIQIVGEIPSVGSVHLHARPLRVGRRLIVADTTFLDDSGIEFARGTSTFINQKVGSEILLRVSGVADIPQGSIDALVGPLVGGPLSLELTSKPSISNGLHGTIQGGVQGMLAELAVEHALGGGERIAVVDLDIRYLGRLKVGPLVATVEESGRADPASGRRVARVALTDAGHDNQPVSYVTITWVAPVT
jgi:acyl-coenzyme A thioesterase PaaI-like protein